MVTILSYVYNKMKGGRMKEIKLKFIGLGYSNFYQAGVKIYNNNILVYKGKTYNNELIICLNVNTLYKLVAISMDEVVETYFYVSSDYEYVFAFNRGTYKANNRSITFLLTDYYYNLPIERGEMILWPK